MNSEYVECESYRVKILDRDTYLWGSAGITVNLGVQLLLCIRVDEFGEPITIGTETTSPGSRKTFGVLQPGESYTIPLNGLRGVFSVCNTPHADSIVSCWVIQPRTP